MREQVQLKPRLALVRSPSPMALRILPHDWEHKERSRIFARRVWAVCCVALACAAMWQLGAILAGGR